MKRIILALILSLVISATYAQKRKKGNQPDFKSEMISHYKTFYKEMIKNKDYLSAIQGLNHLIILEPQNVARKDTLGLLYYTVDNPSLAINVLKDSETELGLRTKALAYKKVKDLKQAIDSYEQLLEKFYNVKDAYELAQLQYGVQNFGNAKLTINKALAEAKDEKVQIIVARNSYIETPIKAAFLNILGLIEYNNNVANTDKAVKIFDQALAVDPEFILALENKKGILEKRNTPTVDAKKKQ